jgi:hypothetical protein
MFVPHPAAWSYYEIMSWYDNEAVSHRFGDYDKTADNAKRI